MGKWCEVKCNCPNREPVESHSRFGSYKCGHEDGAFLQFWPGDLFYIGLALDGAFKKRPDEFEVFRKIINWRLYDDEYLKLSSDEVLLWKLEIEQLQRYLSGEVFMGWYELQTWKKFFERNYLLYGTVSETLADGLRLCEASEITGNMIEFFW